MCRRCVWLTAMVMVSLALAGLAQGQSVKINFQLAGATVPDGYLPDTGQVFGDQGNGFSYGWNRDISGDTRDRADAHADQRYDTLVHLQKGEDAIWEIELENGDYDLYWVCGDPTAVDQTNTFDIEGVIFEDPDGQDDFDEFTGTVTVTDGRLTLKPASGAANSKICFIDITAVAVPEIATVPSPADEATDVVRDIVLGWLAGPSATSHDVYFGTDFDAVAGASRANPMDVLVSQGQAAATFDPAGLLDFETTYYWRVDEIAADGTVFEGDVWSFTSEPVAYAIENIVATASNAAPGNEAENTINGSGLNDADEHSVESTDMWLTTTDAGLPVWIQYEFDRVYKMHELLVWNYNVQFEPVLGFGAKDVTVEVSTDGVEWTALSDVEFAQATAAPTYAANTTVDLAGVAARFVRLTVNDNWGPLTQVGLSEVRFTYIPVQAREPQPASGTADVSVDSA